MSTPTLLMLAQPSLKKLTFGGQSPADWRTSDAALRAAVSSLPGEDPVAQYHFSPSRLALTLGAGLVGTGALVPFLARQSKKWFSDTSRMGRLTQQVPEVSGKLHKFIRRVPLQNLVMVAKILLAVDLAGLLTVTGKQIYQKRLSMQEIWAPAHRLGLDGQGVTIGIVDTGLQPTRYLSNEQIQVFPPDGTLTPVAPYDVQGHGSAIGSLFAQALPKSKLVGVTFLDPKHHPSRFQKLKMVGRYTRDVVLGKMPLSLGSMLGTLANRDIETLSNGIRQSLAQDAQVVNLSIGLNFIPMAPFLMAATLGAWESYHVHRLLQPILGRGENQAQWEQRIAVLRQSVDNGKRYLLQKLISKEDRAQIQKAMAPYLRALDEAKRKNVPVVLATGNNGPIPEQMRANASLPEGAEPLRLQSFFGLIPHPALLTVGSTNSEGQLSHFTSQWTQQTAPHVAGNGSGELTTSARFQRSWLGRVLFPLRGLTTRLFFTQPAGTSFAAPDIAITLAMMKQANPDLTVDQLFGLLKAQTKPAVLPENGFKLGQGWLKQLQENPDALQAHIRSRVGAGPVNRMGALRAALESRLQDAQ
jgi:hypothetical protein